MMGGCGICHLASSVCSCKLAAGVDLMFGPQSSPQCIIDGCHTSTFIKVL